MSHWKNMLARETIWTDRRTRLETRARVYAEDQHLSPRETNQFLLALKFAEECGLDAEQVVQIVERFDDMRKMRQGTADR